MRNTPRAFTATAFFLLVTLTMVCPVVDAQTAGKTRPKTVSVAQFQADIQPLGLIFELPAGFKAVAVRENPDLFYQFAIQPAKSGFEVRYSVMDLRSWVAKYEASLSDTNQLMIHPDKIWEGMAMANGMNMTRGKMIDLQKFDPGAVKREFGADDGGVQFFFFQCEFGKGYKSGEVVYLHKNGVADVAITFLCKDEKKLLEWMRPAFHNLRFEE